MRLHRYPKNRARAEGLVSSLKVPVEEELDRGSGHMG
jgi:hypothetical protein